jgi:polysaccharide export outer membrane protein
MRRPIKQGTACPGFSTPLNSGWELSMKCLFSIVLALATASALAVEPIQQGMANHSEGPVSDAGNLPVEKLGPDDLLGISVYDSPELSRTVRVDADGNLRLPMMRQRIAAAGLFPYELEKSITSALISENILVNPVVTVSVVEYRSRPITVAGAVKSPVTFQATGNVTLLDAISRAGGIAENAGTSILVSRPAQSGSASSTPLTQRIPVRSLLDGEDPTLNIKLDGGEQIRVPEAGRIFVAGNVKKPGVYAITDGPESSVLKAIALSQGLDSFSAHTAYIYRSEAGMHGKNEIPIDLKGILNRKVPDPPLYADDMLYIQNSAGRRNTAKIVELSLGLGLGLASVLLLATH